MEGDLLINLIEGKLIKNVGMLGEDWIGIWWWFYLRFFIFWVEKSVWIFWESGI